MPENPYEPLKNFNILEEIRRQLGSARDDKLPDSTDGLDLEAEARANEILFAQSLGKIAPIRKVDLMRESILMAVNSLKSPKNLIKIAVLSVPTMNLVLFSFNRELNYLIEGSIQYAVAEGCHEIYHRYFRPFFE